MRKLASVKTISNLQPIEGKDRIVLATVDGWHVIVRKGEYEIGDQCVYIEIDSVLPEKPEFEFLRSKNFRIKTMKMGNVVSQGICFPMNILPPGNYANDQDVTEIIGVKQYERTMDVDPVVPNVQASKKYPKFLMRMKWFRKLVCRKRQSDAFPSFISKTDETRIQNIPFILNDKETKWVATEKIDGQSGTFVLVRHRSKFLLFNDKFELIVCSRNRRLPVPDKSSYWAVAEKYHIEDALKGMIDDSDDWVAIQGECIGPNIQKNKYHCKDYDLYVFNVLYPEGRMCSKFASEFCAEYGLKFVPILETGITLPDTVDEVLKYAHGKSQLYDTLREGIVFRSQDGKGSFKAVDPLFLLRHDE